MATQTRAQSTAKRKNATRNRQPEVSGLSLWAKRSRAFLDGAIPKVHASDRLKREIFGTLLVLFALLSSWALGRGAQDGAFIAWWSRVLRGSLGNGAFLVPVFAALTAVRAWSRTTGPIVLIRHYLGASFFTLGVTVLLSFGKVGGMFGAFFGDISRAILGEVASGLVTFVLGVIGVCLLADTDLLTLGRDIHRLIPSLPKRPTPTPTPRSASAPTTTPRPVARGISAWTAPALDVDPAPVSPDSEPAIVSTGRLPRVSNPGRPEKPSTKTVKAEPVVPAAATPDEPVLPVINLPQQPKQGKVDEGAPAAPPAGPVQVGLPFPLPSITRLPYYEQVMPEPAQLQDKADVIESTLRSFKVNAKVREINPGPAVTQFALEPGNGVKVRRITELQNDLALALAAESIRVEAPIPGQARVGIEIPNHKIATVGLREVLESPVFTNTRAKLPLPLGRDVNGHYIVGDLTRMPHLLIAGATGSGKSVCINAIISTLISIMQPDELKLLMIDPKMVELVGYNGVPHLQCPVVTEMDKVVSALRMVLREMNRRYELFKDTGVRNLDGYRLHTRDDEYAEKLPYLVVIIDELADLMMTTPDEVETLLARLTQMARATGIHLIIATQRPSVNVLTGLIKANVPARIAFAVSSMTDSRVVLDMPGAERLLGRGDMLYLPPDEAKPTRVQGAFIDEDVKTIVDHWLAVSPVPQYAPEWLNLPSSGSGSSSGGGAGFEEEGEEPLMQQALDVVRAQGTASASMLQRRLRIGYNRAARIIEQMEEDGIIGPADGAKGRPVLVRFEEPDLG